MVRRLVYFSIAVAAAWTAWSLDLDGRQRGAAGERDRTGTDLFYNYYVPPHGCAGVGAQLYPCPRPTPPLVGHTYVTYQPLMPHEFLYRHHRTYVRRNPDAGYTKTSVHWRHCWLDCSWLRCPPRPLPSPPLPCHVCPNCR